MTLEPLPSWSRLSQSKGGGGSEGSPRGGVSEEAGSPGPSECPMHRPTVGSWGKVFLMSEVFLYNVINLYLFKTETG